VDPGDVVQEGVRRANAEGNVEEHLTGGDAPGTPPGFIHEQSHLLVARSAKAQLIGTFSDDSADVSRAKGTTREPVDLVPESNRDPWREEAHAQTVTEEVSPLCVSSAPKP
jgi:hypothetical protein